MSPSSRPYLRVTWSDPESDATGYLVVDRFVCGIATGGLRTRAGCTLEEVEDLAREMSLKTGAYGLPVGGAKGGIDHPADAPDVDDVRLRYVQAMKPFLDSVWTTAGDLGTPQAALDAVFARAGLGESSLRAALRRSPDPAATAANVARRFAEHDDETGAGLTMPDLIGGYGVAEAALAGLTELGVESVGSRAVVQGFGAMGGSSALYLARAGVRVVAIADALGLLVDDRGLDVPALLAARGPGGVVDRAAVPSGVEQRPGDGWLDVDCDVLVPAAISYAITSANCDRVRARLIAEAANVPVTEEAERLLAAREIVVVPDFVANAGAAAWAWWVVFAAVDGPESARTLLSRQVRPLTERIVAEWNKVRTPLRVTARAIADVRGLQLTERYGGPVERMPLFEAGADAAMRAEAFPVV